MKTGLYHDPIFLEHDTGQHPENAGRLVAVAERLEADKVLQNTLMRHPRKASQEEITRVHTLEYMRKVEEAVLTGQGFMDTPECVLSAATYDVALHAAGALIDSVVDVAEGTLDNAFVACRPPGHHAEQSKAMGFCYFNNVAVAAAALTQNMGFERVLVFDFDVHHGNGTQHSFEHRKDIYFCSIHQDPLTLYPGTGFANEIGHGEGKGYTLNIPMQPGSTDEDYLTVFNNQILPAFKEYNPQFILISAGFDAHRDDPLAGISLSTRAFDEIMLGMKQLAQQCCKGKLVSTLEGGYNYEALADCVSSHVGILHSDEDPARGFQ